MGVDGPRSYCLLTPDVTRSHSCLSPLKKGGFSNCRLMVPILPQFYLHGHKKQRL